MRTALAATLALLPLVASGQETTAQLAKTVSNLAPHVVAEADREPLRSMLRTQSRPQIAAANQASSTAWAAINSRDDWERFRHQKLAFLRNSLGELPPRPAMPKSLVTGRIHGDGFQIHNVVFESRPGLMVTANLYMPDPPRRSMPGMQIVHSHHNPKEQGELQDMGMTWARAGCYVLVPDMLGHGERRQHPFTSAADFGGSFQVGRQDYYFRYDTSLQLYLLGDSLMGWFVHDLMTGVDLLLAQPGIDRQRIVLLGSVAAGGDPAAVTAALDERIACVVPFNFGGPQPETRYPLPDDAETSFNYAGSGSWESTRNLYRSAADGFLPWAIVGSVAPRHVIHAHEFAWDQERDPVWTRYQKIWGFYGAEGKLAFAHGHGTLTGDNPPGSHCNNIGAVHRRQIHEAFRRWFSIDVQPEHEYSRRRSREELLCLTDEARRQFQSRPLCEIVAKTADERLATARQAREKLPPADRLAAFRESWTRLLGDTKPREFFQVLFGSPKDELKDGLLICRFLAEPEPGVSVPVLSINPPRRGGLDPRTVIAVAPDGIAGLLRRRSDWIAAKLAAGHSVMLVDVRGTGASSPGSDRGQQSAATSISATHFMLSQSLLAGQLRDLRSIIAWHFRGKDFGGNSVILFGDSGVEPLAVDKPFRYPRRIDGRPAECQPTGPLLALLAALYEPNVTEVITDGSLVSFRSVLNSPFVQVPHDCIVPGVLREGDLADLVAALAPCKVTQSNLVDGRGRSGTLDQ